MNYITRRSAADNESLLHSTTVGVVGIEVMDVA